MGISPGVSRVGTSSNSVDVKGEKSLLLLILERVEINFLLTLACHMVGSLRSGPWEEGGNMEQLTRAGRSRGDKGLVESLFAELEPI